MAYQESPFNKSSIYSQPIQNGAIPSYYNANLDTALGKDRLPQDSCGMGFIANIDNNPSYSIVTDGAVLLKNMEHRGAVGSDPTVGDGVGFMLQINDGFARWAAGEAGIELPAKGEYAVGNFFLPKLESARALCQKKIHEYLEENGIKILGWREIHVNSDILGETVLKTEPYHGQLFISRDPFALPTHDMFDRKLFVARKQIFNQLIELNSPEFSDFYCCSLSRDTIVYKGMLIGEKILDYYQDLRNERMITSFVLVHQRFSTNTLPKWRLAHPFRMICHNGEINTIRGNINWIRARHANMASACLQDDVKKIWPIVADNQSDSASFDNVLELLVQGGYPLAHAIMMLIPEAWEDNALMSPERRAFYEYHAALMEPWDGPAAIAFSDGKQIGTVLDRNGLRPARYCITKDRRIIMASESGALPVSEDMIEQKLRLQPGKMLLVDLEQKRVIPDEEIKKQIAQSHPFQKWLNHIQLRVENLPDNEDAGQYSELKKHDSDNATDETETLSATFAPQSDEISSNEWLELPSSLRNQRIQRSFGYTREDAKFKIGPMVRDSAEAIGAMGTDTPLAILSDRQPLLSEYFHQLFAQVTNPPIDPIRERVVMSLTTFLGPKPNVFHPEQRTGVKRLGLVQPILTNSDFRKIKNLDNKTTGLKPICLDITWNIASGASGMEQALHKLVQSADEAIIQGSNIILLSDKAVGSDRAAIPALLATSAVHHHLIRSGRRTLTGLTIETAEIRDTHQFATLVGFGIEAINPYMAFDIVEQWRQHNARDLDALTAQENYIKAIDKGLLKVMSKMGISTLQSYCGAQIFEIVGLSKALVDKWFCGTNSQIGGANLLDIARDTLIRHQRAFHGDEAGIRVEHLDAGGDFAWRFNGQRHAWTPDTVASLQHAVRNNSELQWKEFSEQTDAQTISLRGLWGIGDKTNNTVKPLEVDKIEPAKQIVHRFSTGAMSFGSLSREAHSTLAVAMNKIGGRSNTGEGGEQSDRFIPSADGTSMRSSIKQVASGRFGVNAHYLCNADVIQIKMAQGAKPGEGGQLPGHKVDAIIAEVRRSTPGVGLISPPPHHDIYSIEDLAELIFDLKNINPRADISVKLVSSPGVGTVAAGVAKAKADHITISGYDGGTGASPLSSIKHAGSPWELGLAETQQMLVASGLRNRVTLQVDGGLRTARDVVIAALLGADEFGFSTAPLIATGCLMMRKCHLNTCPVGIATQDERLRKRFVGTPEHVINYLFFVAEDIRKILSGLGYNSLNEIIGKSNLLYKLTTEEILANKNRPYLDEYTLAKIQSLDFSKLFAKPKAEKETDYYNSIKQTDQLSNIIDKDLINRADRALQSGSKVRFSSPIKNSDRAVGTMLSHEVTSRYGEKGLEDNSILIDFEGNAGQSFGAFLAKGVELRLKGDANDYVGKGLSGGRIVVYPPSDFTTDASEEIIVGNTCLYGATAGECYISGIAGERFGVRNAGAITVVEGVGDHGCEYMTGGIVTVIGKTGRNFAAGMSGGIAYIWDPDEDFSGQLNHEMVDLISVMPVNKVVNQVKRMRNTVLFKQQHLDDYDAHRISWMLQQHIAETGSKRANYIVDNWSSEITNFKKVLPRDYAQALSKKEEAQLNGTIKPLSKDNVVELASTRNRVMK